MEEIYTEKGIYEFDNYEFMELKGIKKILPTQNIIKVELNTENIMELFKKKFLEKVKNNRNYNEGFKIIVKSNLEEYEHEIIEELKLICSFKFQQLEGKILLEEIVKKPNSKIEKISFQTFIDNTIKEIFGYNIEEEISNLLVDSWLREEELSVVNILDEFDI